MSTSCLYTTIASRLAAVLDRGLEATGWGGLFYYPTFTRGSWHVAFIHDPQHGKDHLPGWTLQVGRWELVKDGKGPIALCWPRPSRTAAAKPRERRLEGWDYLTSKAPR